uniref:BRCT domain-containing protein n=1 Tax=Panagrellus redivivus TaxID=6233 RepID=A0A7E4VS73_PANRE
MARRKSSANSKSATFKVRKSARIASQNANESTSNEASPTKSRSRRRTVVPNNQRARGRTVPPTPAGTWRSVQAKTLVDESHLDDRRAVNVAARRVRRTEKEEDAATTSTMTRRRNAKKVTKSQKDPPTRAGKRKLDEIHPVLPVRPARQADKKEDYEVPTSTMTRRKAEKVTKSQEDSPTRAGKRKLDEIHPVVPVRRARQADKNEDYEVTTTMITRSMAEKAKTQEADPCLACNTTKRVQFEMPASFVTTLSSGRDDNAREDSLVNISNVPEPASESERAERVLPHRQAPSDPKTDRGNEVKTHQDAPSPLLRQTVDTASTDRSQVKEAVRLPMFMRDRPPENEALSSSGSYEVVFVPVNYTLYRREIRKKRRRDAAPDSAIWDVQHETGDPTPELVDDSWPSSGFMWSPDRYIEQRCPPRHSDDEPTTSAVAYSSRPIVKPKNKPALRPRKPS